MKRGLVFLPIVLWLLIVVEPSNSHAAVYKYVKEDGTVGFVDNLQSVPEEYRQTAILVRGKLKEGEIDPDDPRNFMAAGASQPAGAQIAPGTPTAMGGTEALTGTRGAAPFSRRLLRSFLVMLAAGAVYGILFFLGDLRERKRAHLATRMTLVSLVTLFLVFTHARDVVTIFTKAGNEVEYVKQRSAEKGRGAAQFMRALDAFFENVQ